MGGRARIAAVLLALAVACGGDGGTGLPKNGTLVALGDSIAAGQGFGKADGYPNNPGAYAGILAGRLGWQSGNFSISGACTFAAGEPGADPDTAPLCGFSVMRDELPHVRQSIRGSVDVVTLTVGPNDVEFALCAAFLLSPVPLPGPDPCGEPLFSKHLGAYERNLTRLLAKIREQFPKARTVVTTIYNPAPPDPGATGEVCPLVQTAASIQKPADILNPLALGATARRLQADIHGKTQKIIDGVGGVVKRVAQASGALVARLDFRGHDMCRSMTGGKVEDVWAYGPLIDVKLTGGFLDRTPQHWSLVLPDECRDLSSDPPPIHVSLPLGALALDATVKANCAPHPTAQGHRAIAEAILRVLKP